MRSALRARIFVSLALVATAPALAFDFVVTEYADDSLAQNPGCTVGHCTLREAVIAANAGASADRILLSAGVYRLTLFGSGEEFAATGDLDVREDLEIVGPGATMTFLDGYGLADTIVSASASGLDFTLRKLTIVNGEATGVVLGSGSHTVEECEVRAGFSNGLEVLIGSTVTVRRSTIATNSVYGLFVSHGSATVENSTISGNGSHELVVNLSPGFSCKQCTISDPLDHAEEVSVTDSTVSFVNSLVAGDCVVTSGAAISSLGGNLESPSNLCGYSQVTDQNSVAAVDLALGGLAANGGPTQTHLPGLSSFANGSAVDALCVPLGNDQRGVARVSDCESGSVERTSARVETPIFHDGFLQGDTDAWSATVPPPP